MTDYLQVSNTQIVFTVPKQVSACTASSQITVNGISQPLTFSYNPALTPTISSLSRDSSSPILKSTLVITGTNFGTLEQVEVYLFQDGVRKYYLTPTSASETSIICILGGGRSGHYDVVVFVSTKGASIPSPASSFQYRIFVDSLSITSGHQGGGYELTITG